MARLPRGERNRRRWNILAEVRKSFGVKESEIAEETGLHRRVVNNYLRELQDDDQVQKHGWYWYDN